MIGPSKSGLAALSLLLTPLPRHLVHAVTLAVVVLLPLLLVGNALAVWANWQEWDKRMLPRVLPAAAAGAGAGHAVA